MNIQKLLLCLILSLLSTSVWASKPVCVIEDSFLGVPYTIKLYDLNSYFQSLDPSVIQNNVGSSSGPLFFLGFSPHNKTFFCKYLPYNGVVDSFLFCNTNSLDKTCSVKSYEPKRIKDDIFNRINYMESINKKASMYELRLEDEKIVKTSKHTGSDYQPGWGSVPVVFYVYDGADKRYGERANLFDMFSQQVDSFLLTYGFAENVSCERKNFTTNKLFYETHLQISIFGSIEIESMGFFQFGFFQYTFDTKHQCYHRAFKPWTPECLNRLSNAPTQILVKSVMHDWFVNLPVYAGNTSDAGSVTLLSELSQHKYGAECIKQLDQSFALSGLKPII